MYRLHNRAQFEAVLSSAVVAKTENFALHRRSTTVGASTQKQSANQVAASQSMSGDPATKPAVQNQAVRHNKTSSDRAELFDTAAASLGAMVPKRWARKAVTRNLVKRQIYAVAREQLPKQPPHAYVVRLRQPFALEKFQSGSSGALKQAVRTQLLTLLKAQQAS